ncbi:MAG: hypothetical protein EOO93_31735, partial [Pedobacter sp.]
MKNGFAQTYKTGVNLQQQNLNSELYRIQNDQSSELVSQQTANDLNWFKGRVYADATYEYTNDKLKAGLSLPLSYNHINYSDPVNELDNRLNKLFVNPSLNIKYQTGIENYVSANYFYKNELGGIDDVYRGTVLKNYRSLFANNAPISELKTHSFRGEFNFRKAMQMFFFNASASY